MSRRKTRCIPWFPTSPAPPPTDWRAYCGRVIEEADARWPSRWPAPNGLPRLLGICPSCWKRAAEILQMRVTIGRIDENGRTGAMHPNPETDISAPLRSAP